MYWWSNRRWRIGLSVTNKQTNRCLCKGLKETLLHLPQQKEHSSKTRSKDLAEGSKGKFFPFNFYNYYFFTIIFSISFLPFNPFFFLYSAISLFSLSVEKCPSVEFLTEGQNLTSQRSKLIQLFSYQVFCPEPKFYFAIIWESNCCLFHQFLGHLYFGCLSKPASLSCNREHGISQALQMGTCIEFNPQNFI